MNSKFVRAICLVVLMVVVLLTGATPVAAHSMDMGATHNCQPSATQGQASVPMCCVIQDCQFSHSTTANLPPAPDQFTLSKLIQMVRLNANLLPESSSYQKAPCQQDTSRTIPHTPGADCPCRNSLQAEEPPLI